jgi:flagellar biosynthesis/type III secretory pathway protein FliH
LFNPTPQRAAPQAWAPNTVLQPVRQGEAAFANTDWDSVPRLDYRTEKFRQLAIPDPARVVDDASEFEPWQPQQIGTDPTTRDAQAEGQSRKTRPDATADQAGVAHPQAKGASSDPTDPALPRDAQGYVAHQESHELQADATDLAATEDGAPVDANDPSVDAQADASTDAHADEHAVTASKDTDGVNESAQDAADHMAHAQEQGAEASTDQPVDQSADASGAQSDSTEPALDSAAVQEACDAARREGLEQGQAEGRAQGREEALAQAQQELQDALQKAEADKSQALQQLREELEGEIEPIKRQLSKALEQVESLVGQPDKLYEHIKRLSLHLAEQMVLGELNLSSAAIERLIQRCLDELDLHGNHVVTVELNPQDKARLQERAGELSHTLSLQAVPSLQAGSVRVMVNDTMVEDLVGNRLEALARGLLVQPEVWREQSPFFRQPLAQRDTDIQDAAARVVASRESAPVRVAPETGRASATNASEVAEVTEAVDAIDAFDAQDHEEAVAQSLDSIVVTPPIPPHEPTGHPGEQND